MASISHNNIDGFAEAFCADGAPSSVRYGAAMWQRLDAVRRQAKLKRAKSGEDVQPAHCSDDYWQKLKGQ